MASKVTVSQAVLRSPSIRRGGPAPSDDTEQQGRASIDEVDRGLVQAILADSKVSNRDLARRLDISESAAGSRLRALIAGGVLVFTAVIDWENAGFEWWVTAFVKISRRPAADVASDLGRIPRCVSAAVVLGSPDVAVYFLVRDRAELRCVIDALGSVDGVADIDVELATDTRVSALGRQIFFTKDPTPIHLPDPCVDLDHLDLSIMQALIIDGRQSNRKIARFLRVSEGTVRARVTRLTESGLVQVMAMVDPVAFGLPPLLATVMVRADRARIDAIVTRFMASKNVVFAAVCLGNWDVHVAVLVGDHIDLMEFVASTIESVEGVHATETVIVADIVRFNPCLKRVATINSVA